MGKHDTPSLQQPARRTSRLIQLVLDVYRFSDRLADSQCYAVQLCRGSDFIAMWSPHHSPSCYPEITYTLGRGDDTCCRRSALHATRFAHLSMTLLHCNSQPAAPAASFSSFWMSTDSATVSPIRSAMLSHYAGAQTSSRCGARIPAHLATWARMSSTSSGLK